MSDIRLETGEVKRRADLKVGDEIRLEGGETIRVGSVRGQENTVLQGGEVQPFLAIS